MARPGPDLVDAALDMLILKDLRHDLRHGLAIANRIQRMSKDTALRTRLALLLGSERMDLGKVGDFTKPTGNALSRIHFRRSQAVGCGTEWGMHNQRINLVLASK
jgi:hypothetical protein